ncbi:hypothetical protein [Paenibacillus thiaminolyticus]|uniref:Flp pilus assembly protein, ATPase CpaE n=1 Tax=Paenibacillus thiaminolyticus TaxID=49283 RepID=A0A3A3GEZ6_PANTH|nr:hypothetical protein [Paenibacillus thiaminolyticus]RJG21352.1 hypothetical protein DQX05_21875 [Paenibacillus thiaminolyticus]
MHTIIIGTGHEQLDDLIQSDMESQSLGQVVSKVTTRQILVSRIMETSASLVFIGDELIGEAGTDDEWERIIDDIRRISVSIRIVFFCDRPDDDLFLTKLTTYSIYDIFNHGRLPETYLTQLAQQPAFKNIEKFRPVHQVQSAAEQFLKKSKESQAEEIIQKGVRQKVQLSESETEPQIIERTITKEVPVPVYEHVFLQSKLIVVASAYEGAGSSTVCKLLAEYLATCEMSVAIMESPFPKYSWFELINASRIPKVGVWRSWHRQLQESNEIELGTELKKNGVAYMIRSKDEIYTDWDITQYAYLIGYGRNYPILFVDIGSGTNNERESVLLRQAAHILLVTGYDPLRVNRERDNYRTLLAGAERDKVLVVANKSTNRLEKEHSENLKQAYKTNNLFHIPAVPEIQEMLLNDDNLWISKDYEEQREVLLPYFQALCNNMFPSDHFRAKKKEGTLLNKLKALVKS